MNRVHHRTLRPPTREDVHELAASYHLSLDDEEADHYVALIERALEGYEKLDALPEPAPETKHTRRVRSSAPEPSSDPHNAFLSKCHIPGAESGPLAGYDVGVKDNIAVAGVEMTCSTRPLRGYVPNRDATVVTRILEAGGSIVGKTNMSEMGVSGTGELSLTGPVLNPHDPDHLAGGSSSGSAVAVVTGAVDAALGTDQAGSMRIPAAWSGCVGHKPTWGLVPYTGAVGHGVTFDHIGPMARTVEDCARVLQVIAGPDSYDPRQNNPPTDEYLTALSDNLDGTTIGVLEEGFLSEEHEVDETVRDAAEQFETVGAEVRSVSIPWHSDGALVWRGIAAEATAAAYRDDGIGHYLKGYYDTQYNLEFGKAKRSRANEFPPTYKFLILLGGYLMDEHYGYFYGKAQNVCRALSRAYDEALSEVDVLVMPTAPVTAYEVGEPAESVAELVQRAQTGIRTANSSPFDVTGHPAVSVPCGTVEELPVGMMIVGDHFDDATVLKAAHAFERSGAVDV